MTNFKKSTPDSLDPYKPDFGDTIIINILRMYQEIIYRISLVLFTS